jgi:orotate phosphoribosyltransferase
MKAARILNDLAEMDAVLTDGHFIFSSGNHGSAYIDIRTVAPDAAWMKKVSIELAKATKAYDYDLIIGPETLGRDLARYGASKERCIGLWCNIVDATDDTPKHAVFPPKLERVFAPLIAGMKVAIFDDLLTTGRSIKVVSDLVAEFGGEVVVAAAVVRRSPEIGAEDCGAPALEVLADIEGFEVFTPEQCADYGPCSQQVPVVLRPGHGHKWIVDHPDYPVAS